MLPMMMIMVMMMTMMTGVLLYLEAWGGGSENKQCVRPSRPTPGLRITGTTAVRGGVYFAPVRAGLALAEIGAIFQDGGNKRRLIHGTKVFW